MGRCPNPLAGGLSRRGGRHRYNKTQLRMGRKVEMEHTRSKRVAGMIARDHLTEDPRYYSKLKRMEHNTRRRRGR